MLLAGDIGGTKTCLDLFSPERGPHSPLASQTYASTHYASLDAVVRAFMSQTAEQPRPRTPFAKPPVIETLE